VTRSLASRFLSLVILQFWLKLASALVFSSLVGAILAALLARDGSPAVGNSALIDFALSPIGALTIAVLPMMYLAALYFEQSCILRVLADPKGNVVQSLKLSLVALPRVLLMATIQTMVALLFVAPFVFLAWFVYWLMLSDADINFYLANKPPKFIVAVILGIILSLGAIIVLGWLLLKWFHALPKLIFERTLVLPCLWQAWHHQSAKSNIIVAIVSWFIVHFLLYITAPWVIAIVTSRLFSLVEHDSEKSVWAGVFILLSHSIVLMLVTISSQCWLTAAIWTTFDRRLEIEASISSKEMPHPKSWTRPLILLIAASIVSLLIGFGALQKVLDYTVRQSVQIVAHRAGAKGFPENSLSALEHAIAVGADSAEIDVQQSKEGTIFVTHDRDLRRMAGRPLVISEATDAELRKTDIGSQMRPPAPSESLATLEEFLKRSQNKIRLSIELKYYGFKPSLAEAVAALLDQYPSRPAHEIISLEYKALEQVAALRPTIRRGYLVSASVGDITKLDANFLSVSQGTFSPELLERARQRGMQVAVWTINDRESIFRLMVQGAELIVTDDPEMAVEVAREYQQLPAFELLLIRLREALSP
jgi:glycerophosphoryl diester phosphodiesterase